MKIFKQYSYLLVFLLVSVACESTFTPKPYGYNYINLPAPSYEIWQDSTKPYSFEKNKHATIKPYITKLINEEDDYVLVEYPNMAGELYVTYQQIGNNIDTLNSLINNSFRLSEKHKVKATGWDTKQLFNTEGKYAMAIEIDGDVPSQYQVYVHDSTTNFIRIALYFNTALKNDSLAPVIDYLKEDMHHILKTVEWENNGK
ncbi:gliding motility lipoprotein GldD [Cyclobacteriaceae bacterium]|jgi:gliding motility-associated lipoprotein GldD|nr:gliding motility lipoprotein GldD [Cyclobacteriaceae bacterium]